MRFLHYGKDGGYESTVWGFWLVEIKSLFSIALLCFEDGSRDAYHSHAFNCVSWLLWGGLREEHGDPSGDDCGVDVVAVNTYRPSFAPIITRRDTFHKVVSRGRTWVLTFRGPWASTWREYLPAERRAVTLTHGRIEVPHV